MKTTEKPTQETLDEWHKNPANWKFGVFYYNKLDKRIFPPKRVEQLGWTINFANPLSIVTLLVVVVLIFILIRFLKSL